MTLTPRQASTAAIEKAALELIADNGFDETSVEEIAAAAGISRRTFFRYFGSKNDILFGNFDVLLRSFEDWLSSVPEDRPMFDVLTEGVMRFNRFATDGSVAHRQRMELIMHTPALRANASLRNAEWSDVIARFAAHRLGEGADALEPKLIGHVVLAASTVAYEQWLRDESSNLHELMERALWTVQHISGVAVPQS